MVSLLERTYSNAANVLSRPCCFRHHSPTYHTISHVSPSYCCRISSHPRSWSPGKFSLLIIFNISPIGFCARLLPPSSCPHFHYRHCGTSGRVSGLFAHKPCHCLVLILVQLHVHSCWYVSSGSSRIAYTDLDPVGRMTSMRGLVAYPMVLFYGSFGIMAIFSSRGSTVQVAKVTTAT